MILNLGAVVLALVTLARFQLARILMNFDTCPHYMK